MQYRVLAVHPELATAGTVVDVAHALTDVLEAYLNRTMRVPALLDSTVATTLALSSLRAINPRAGQNARERKSHA